MKLDQILFDLTQKGIQLKVEGTELKIRAPKGVMTEEIRNKISKYKSDFLRILDKKTEFSSVSTPMVRVPRNDAFPASFQQERMWSVDQLTSNPAALNIGQALLLHGNLDIAILKDCWNEIINRHETLRTKFIMKNGSLIQVIVPDLEVEILVEEQFDLSESNQKYFIERSLELDAQLSFDLSQPPLFRLRLLRFSNTFHALVLTIHHIIIDGLSINLLFKEIQYIYHSRMEKKDPLQELDIQYGDYAVWQRKYLEGELLQKGMEFWKNQLSGVSNFYPIIPDAIQKSDQFVGSQKHFIINAQTWSSVQQVSKQYGVTPAIVLLTAFKILIYKYSNEQDIVVASPVSGRVNTKLQDMIGSFADLVLLRTKMNDSEAFSELLSIVQKVTLQAHSHQHIPLNFIADFIPQTKNNRYKNLFQLLFNFIDIGEQEVSEKIADSNKAAIRGTLFDRYTMTRDVDLFFVVTKFGNEIKGCLAYNYDLFENDTISSFLDSYLLILDKCVSAPETAVKAFIITKDLALHKEYIQSQSAKLNLVEQAIQLIPEVHDCKVLLRENQLIAYVVSDGFSSEKFDSILKKYIPEEYIPYAYVHISNLPLDESGSVDENTLRELEVIDKELTENWEKELNSHPQIEQALVTVQPKQDRSLKRLHIKDLFLEVIPGSHSDLSSSAATFSKRDIETGGGTLVSSHHDGGPLTIPQGAPKTLTDALIQTATKLPNKEIVYVLTNEKIITQTYSDLLKEAKCILNGLIQKGLKTGDRVILQIVSLRDYFPALWGCVLGGFHPVTVAVAKTYQEDNAVIRKLYNTWELLNHPTILASQSLVEPLQNLNHILPLSEINVLAVEQVRDNPPTDEIYECKPDNVAFLQLTSGSTGVPKCIQETHKGIITHIHAGQQFNNYQEDDVCLNWLPVDHVVPILTCHFKDTYLGCQQIEVATDVVLTSPLSWLNLMSKYKVTHSWSPNFGFKLISDALLKESQNKYDLSSLKFLMNAGEQVTPKVVKEFLNLTAPFGVTSSVMQPAFGMAEVCTCMTYQNDFSFESNIDYIHKSSLGGQLVRANATDKNISEFTQLGPPVPGVQIRIADANNKVLPEGVIGRFQIKGDVVTPGYLYNDKANAEAYVGDGWFNSGDLGYILNGKLVLTGREKEMIIINGANYYCYEIEDIVNTIDGVQPTYVGAIEFPDPETGTEGLVIFFVPKKQQEIPEYIELLRKIRKAVTTQLGISPIHVIPIPKDTFPKTTSGKIQRTRLKSRMETDECQAIIKTIDIHLKNDRTIPSWFFSKVWKQKELPDYHLPIQKGVTLIFGDGSGLNDFLSMKFQNYQIPDVKVSFAKGFTRLSNYHYQIDIKNQQDYLELLKKINQDGMKISRIIHLGHYQETNALFSKTSSIDDSKRKGIDSLLYLIQALEQAQGSDHPVKLYFVGTKTQSILPTDQNDPNKAAILGMLKTFPQELPWLKCVHIDVPLADIKVTGDFVWNELFHQYPDLEIAFREGKRMVAGLQEKDLSKEDNKEIPIKIGGIYLVSGGLGGIGVEISKYLLEHYQAKLLVVGRSKLEKPSAAKEEANSDNKLINKMRIYQELKRLPGEINYQAIDICDDEGLRNFVEQGIHKYEGKQLDGVFHLAGTYHEQFLLSETSGNMSKILNSKVLGTWRLHQLIQNNVDALFVQLSSVYGYFGATGIGAYAAANAFQSSFYDYQRSQGYTNSYCLDMSMWDEIGMSQGYYGKELLSTKGYYVMSPKQAMYSLLAALSSDYHKLLIGLNSSSPKIQSMSSVCEGMQELTGQVVVKLPELNNLEVYDRFGQLSKILVTSSEQGKDLRSFDQSYNQISQQQEADKETVQEIIAIWKETLKISEVGIHDDFFELGGDSILLTQVYHKLNDQWNFELNVADMVKYPTIHSLSLFVFNKFKKPLDNKEIEDQIRHSGQTDQAGEVKIIDIHAEGTKSPLFLVPGGLGLPKPSFIPLSKYLDSDRPVYSFELHPGNFEVASMYIKEMMTVQPQGPYILGGHSGGAWIAFEMAQQLLQQGHEVDHLVIIDMPAPAILRKPTRDLLNDKRMWEIVELFNEEDRVDGENRNMTTDGSIPAFRDLIPSLEILKYTETWLNNYVLPKDIKKVRTVLLRAETSYEELEETVFCSPPEILEDEYWGWKNLSSDLVDLHYVSGNHVTMVRDPHVKKLAEIIDEHLASKK